MARIQRILLIDSRKNVETELVLKVANFEVERCEDVCTAINRYDLYRHSSNRFDLIIAVTDRAGQERLGELYRERYIDYLVLFHRRICCNKGYCVEGQLAHLCNPVSVLSCIEKFQELASGASRAQRWQDELINPFQLAN